MCFKSKIKTPKTNPDSLKAPEPVLIEEPKGVDFGSSTDDQSTDTGTDMLRVDKAATDKGDGSSSAVSSDTGSGTVKKIKPTAAIKRAVTAKKK